MSNDKKVELKDLDLFTLLGLEHLSTEKKAQRIAEIQQIVLTQFYEDDLPNLLSEEDMKTFENMANDTSKAEQINEFLHSKIPNFDKLIFDKMLTAKKEIVKQNMLTRLDVNNKESSDTEVQKDQSRMEVLTKEKETLEKIVSAIVSDNWATTSNLIQTL